MSRAAFSLFLVTALTPLAFSQTEDTNPRPTDPLINPGKEITSDDERAPSVMFEVQSGLDLEADADGALIVGKVKPKGKAAEAGVKTGDLLLEVDDQPVYTADELATFLQDREDASAYLLKLRRGDKEFEVALGDKLDLLGMLIVADKVNRPLVRRVERGSPSDHAGIHRGDIITGISGREIEGMSQFREFSIPLIRKMSEGQEIPLRMVRDGENVDVAVIRPEDAALPLVPAPEPQRPIVVREETKNQTNNNQQYGTEEQTDDHAYLNGLSGFAPVGIPISGFGDNLAGLQPIGQVSTVAASLHHVLDAMSSAGQSGMGNMLHGGNAGFIVVQSNGGQAVVTARVAGFAPGRYAITVHQFGDCGDFVNGSAGQAAFSLGIIPVQPNGRGELQTVANIDPQLLLGRVVSVTQIGLDSVAPAQSGRAVPLIPSQQLDPNNPSRQRRARNSQPSDPGIPNQPRQPIDPNTPKQPRQPIDPGPAPFPGNPTPGTPTPVPAAPGGTGSVDKPTPIQFAAQRVVQQPVQPGQGQTNGALQSGAQAQPKSPANAQQGRRRIDPGRGFPELPGGTPDGNQPINPNVPLNPDPTMAETAHMGGANGNSVRACGVFGLANPGRANLGLSPVP